MRPRRAFTAVGTAVVLVILLAAVLRTSRGLDDDYDDYEDEIRPDAAWQEELAKAREFFLNDPADLRQSQGQPRGAIEDAVAWVGGGEGRHNDHEGGEDHHHGQGGVSSSSTRPCGPGLFAAATNTTKAKSDTNDGRDRSKTPLRLLVLIMSAVDDASTRQMLRNTWLRLPYNSRAREYMPAFELRWRFIVATPPRAHVRRDMSGDSTSDSTSNSPASNYLTLPGDVRSLWTMRDLDINENLRSEFEAHGDLLFVPLADSYMHTAIKYYSALAWAARVAHDADFVLKADTDVALHVELMVQYLNQHYLADVRVRRRHVVVGSQLMQQPVMRAPPNQPDRQKFRVALSDYPLPVYRPFPQGGVTVVDLALVRKLADVAFESECALLIHMEAALMGTYLELIQRRDDSTPIVLDNPKRVFLELGYYEPKQGDFDLATPWIALHKVDPSVIELLNEIQFRDGKSITQCPAGYPPLHKIPWKHGALVLAPITNEAAVSGEASIPSSWLVLLEHQPWREWGQVCWSITNAKGPKTKRSTVPRLFHSSPAHCYVPYVDNPDDGLINRWWLEHFPDWVAPLNSTN